MVMSWKSVSAIARVPCAATVAAGEVQRVGSRDGEEENDSVRGGVAGRKGVGERCWRDVCRKEYREVRW